MHTTDKRLVPPTPQVTTEEEVMLIHGYDPRVPPPNHGNGRILNGCGQAAAPRSVGHRPTQLVSVNPDRRFDHGPPNLTHNFQASASAPCPYVPAASRGRVDDGPVNLSQDFPVGAHPFNCEARAVPARTVERGPTQILSVNADRRVQHGPNYGQDSLSASPLNYGARTAPSQTVEHRPTQFVSRNADRRADHGPVNLAGFSANTSSTSEERAAAIAPIQMFQGIHTPYTGGPVDSKRGVYDGRAKFGEDLTAPSQTIEHRPTQFVSVNADRRVDHGPVNLAGFSANTSSTSEERAAANAPCQMFQGIHTPYTSGPVDSKRGVYDGRVKFGGDLVDANPFNFEAPAAPTQTVEHRPTKFVSVNADRRVDHGPVNFAGVSATTSSSSEERTAVATPRQTVQAIPTSYPTVPTPNRRGVDDCPVNLLGDFQVVATLSSNSQDRAAPTQTVSQRPTKLSVNADKRVDHGSVNFAGVSAAPSSNSEERASTSAALTKDPAGSTNDFTGASFQKRNIPWNLRSTASRVLPLRLRSPTKTPPASPPLTFSDSDDDDGVVLPRAKKVVQSLQLSLACSKQSIDSDSGDDTKSHKRGILGEISPIRLSDSDTE
ncbi:DNA-directed RNA polymerase subunit beta'' [Frankliniella fusca]|uniref:DNA-directed RNA polymerase subunit beta n=1 Tax=Frankliniella fusca TaxID=407009 RepID=A0AAE1HG30_9NEOP|nr:DNA-directed RNA polymerase subunit beta'' [Frankliniella fusca]KAK3921512.1 DNA-directed RNA polymerase subunit beta'' [Frankliniella fusca]